MTFLHSIQKTAGAWTRYRRSSAPVERPEQILAGILQDLEKLNRSTEQDFLQVGSQLMEVRSVARQISADMAALSELISGQGASDACAALEDMLEHSRAADRRVGASGEALGGVLDFSARLRQAFAGLGNTVSVFRTICTLIRIETTRLGTAGVDFGNLAEEVKPLSEKIQFSGEGVLRTVSELDSGAHKVRRKGSDLQASELQALHSLIDRVRASLNSFEEGRERVRDASSSQASGYAAVVASVDDLVQSIQFHDITRQQVEHVIQALRQISPKQPTRGSKDHAVGSANRVALSLQASQLAEAARTFAASVERIENNLDGIAARLREMAEASRTLLGVSNDDQESFFTAMETSLGSIVKAAGGCHAAEQEICRLALDLKSLAGQMRESIADIRGTEINIERIAINATVRATQIGDRGNALNVVAEVMRRLALDSNRQTEDAAGALDSMSDVVARLTDHAGADPTAMLGRTAAAIEQLHSSSEQSRTRVSQIAALGARLADQLAAVRSGFTAGRLFAETADRARVALEKAGTQLGQGEPEQAGNSAQHLEHFARTYTMQSQRDVHESVLAGTTSASASPAALASPETEFGGNVELF
jgi:methyl-accepting chemotaxis protein